MRFNSSCKPVSNSFFSKLHHQNFECIPKTKSLPLRSSTSTLHRPYFCLDTSLNRTLAYAHRCNWGNVLERINVCSYSRFAGEPVSAICATTLHRTSPGFKPSRPRLDLDPIVAGTFPSPLQKQNQWLWPCREAVSQNIILVS